MLNAQGSTMLWGLCLPDVIALLLVFLYHRNICLSSLLKIQQTKTCVQHLVHFWNE